MTCLLEIYSKWKIAFWFWAYLNQPFQLSGKSFHILSQLSSATARTGIIAVKFALGSLLFFKDLTQSEPPRFETGVASMY